MIALLAISLQATLALTEIPDPKANKIRVEIVAGIEKPDRLDWAALNIIRETLTQGTIGFTEMQLLTYGTQAGDPLRVMLAPDHLRIGYSVPPADLKLAGQIADDLMRDALLAQAAVQIKVDELPFRRRSPWAEAWMPMLAESKGVTRADVVRVYRRLFRPDNVSVAVGGKFMPGQAKAAFQDRFATWKTTPVPAARRHNQGSPNLVRSRSGKLTTVTLQGKPLQLIPSISIGQPEIPSNVGTALLACSMLGQGKSSTLYRVLREELGVSYRQEAFLAPSAQGICPTIVFASADPASGDLDIADPLTTAVEKWTEEDRTRSIALARSVVDLDIGIGMLYFAGERPLNEGLDDRVFLQAYWRLRTGRVWDWKAQFDAMERVTLIEARQFAFDWLRSGSKIVITPN